MKQQRGPNKGESESGKAPQNRCPERTKRSLCSPTYPDSIGCQIAQKKNYPLYRDLCDKIVLHISLKLSQRID